MPENTPADQQEKWVEVPFERIDPDTLQRMIQEFVTRDGADWADAGCTLEEKVAQVLRQLHSREAKVVFDLESQTANIIRRHPG